MARASVSPSSRILLAVCVRTITVESEVGGGIDILVLYWPAAAPEEPADASDAVVAAPGCGQIVMIVDDDQALVEITEELLAALGYEPVGFTDPTRALEALRENPSKYAVPSSAINRCRPLCAGPTWRAPPALRL